MILNYLLVRVKILLVAIILLSLSCGKTVVKPGGQNPDKLQNTPGWFYSNSLQSNRYINLRLPDNYNAADDRRYATIYLLDGNWYFDGETYRIEEGGVVKIIEELIDLQLIPEVILVGIGNVNALDETMRDHDFLYGGAELYNKFIVNELIPIIDSRYKTKTDSIADRTLIGHGSAGFMSMYSLCQHSPVVNNVFQNYIALSVFHSNVMSNIKIEEEELYARNYDYRDLHINLYLGVGGNQEPEFLDTFNYLKDKLLSRQYTYFNLGNKVYEGATHSGYISNGIEDGIKYVFQH